jgi:hypothetical protein
MIKFDSIITNGYIDIDTILGWTNKGWKFVTTIPAKQVHPHAMDTDKLTIFSKYQELDGLRTEFTIYDELVNLD